MCIDFTSCTQLKKSYRKLHNLQKSASKSSKKSKGFEYGD